MTDYAWTTSMPVPSIERTIGVAAGGDSAAVTDYDGDVLSSTQSFNPHVSASVSSYSTST